mgnify:CR=1 FL=1
MLGFLKNLKASHVFIMALITILILITIFLDRITERTFLEKFGTTPAAFIQMNARDNQDDRTIGGIRVGSNCGIRPTQRGSPKTGYLRFQ